MFVINQPIFAGDIPANDHSGGRRFYRGRNMLAGGPLQWTTSPEIPADTPDWDDMLGNSIRAGFKAARQTLKPAIVVWGLMACLATLYYAVPASQGFFAAMAAMQERLGLLFPFLGMGLSVGLLAEAAKVCMSEEKRWTRDNSINAVFNLMIFGILGVLQNYLYAFQAKLFGTGTSLEVLVPKVLFDQFVWTVLFANPYQAVLYLWKNRGFSWRKVAAQMRPFKPFWGTQVLPVLIANWFFWIPMVSIIYCFPNELQLPLAILAVTIWVLLLSILTSDNHAEQ
ncbi:MAG: hypothetical protein V4584_12990 [Verrucomicrobiota bacterium]